MTTPTDFPTATPSQVDEARNDAMLARREALHRVAATTITYAEAHKTRKGVDYAAGAAKRGMTAEGLLDRAEAMLEQFATALAEKQAEIDARPADDFHYTVDSVRFMPAEWAEVHGARAADFSTRRADSLRDQIAKARAAQEIIDAADAEYDARGGWARYWIVTSSAHGKVHRYGCGSWRWTTEVALAYEVSGNDDEGVVALLDAGACTRCFPDAPTDEEAAEIRRAAAAKAAAEKATAVVHGEGYAPRNADAITCTACGETQPATKYPTAKGGEVRKTECRACRDARYAAAKADA